MSFLESLDSSFISAEVRSDVHDEPKTPKKPTAETKSPNFLDSLESSIYESQYKTDKQQEVEASPKKINDSYFSTIVLTSPTKETKESSSSDDEISPMYTSQLLDDMVENPPSAFVESENEQTSQSSTTQQEVVLQSTLTQAAPALPPSVETPTPKPVSEKVPESSTTEDASQSFSWVLGASIVGIVAIGAFVVKKFL